MIAVYDLEQFSNFHSCFAVDKESDEEFYFEINDFQNDLRSYYAFLESLDGMVGYNVLGYDYYLIDHLLKNKYRFLGMKGGEIARELYKKAQEAINEKWDFPEWEIDIPQLDLYKIWHFDNPARRTSLKDLQIAMNWPNVIDLPFSHTRHISNNDRIEIRKYNKNDTLSTKYFYTLSRGVIDLRKELKKIYGIPCTNWNDPKIGERIFLKKIARKKQIPSNVIKKWRTHRNEIKFSDCLVDYNIENKKLRSFIDSLKDTDVTKTKGSLNERLLYQGMPYDFGTGGIHGCRRPGVYTSDENSVIMSSDVSSYYPNVPIQFGVYPEHLGPEFCEVNAELFKEKQEAGKKGLKLKREGVKLGLNGVYGKSNDKWSFLYDPKYTMTVTINGQIMLTDLSISLQKAGFKCIMINTDGFEFIVPKNQVDNYKRICQLWMDKTGFELEHDQYKTLAIRDVNNYIGQFQMGKVKRKGDFENDDWRNQSDFRNWHKDPSFKVIPKALEQHFIYGNDIEEYIRSHEDIFDFCGRVKSQSGYKIRYHYLDGYDEKIQELQKRNRVYISKEGGYLYKVKGERQYAVYKGQKIQIFNKFEEKEDYQIDYKWYIRETRKIIDKVEPKQMDMFIQ